MIGVESIVDGVRQSRAMRASSKPIDLDATRVDLALAFGELGFTTGAEIGVEQGAFSEVLCQSNPSLDLLCVDGWTAYAGYRDHVTQAKLDCFYEATKARLSPYKAHLFRSFSVDAAQEIEDGSLDFVYIDSAHDLVSVINDLAAWVPKVRNGGVVSGHDYRRVKGPGQFHVKDAVQAWTSAHDVRPWFVLRGERSPSFFWVFQ